MDKNNKKKTLNSTFTQIFLHLAKSTKDINELNNESYNKGKKEGLEEILNWVKTYNNGDLKYIPANIFINMLNEKSKKAKSKLSKTLQDDLNEDDKDEIDDVVEKRNKRKKQQQPQQNYKFSFKMDGSSDLNILDEGVEKSISTSSIESLNKAAKLNLYDSSNSLLSNCSIKNLTLEGKK